ncbi:hypothetical protein L228DRAFT_249663 [Xylona heveae TC161]|uniref:Copper transport protein n=1 Tax=Xylona heveae (strain CBS 132557 / TC161) TaxID=1328760 RepID=A0A165FD57_XYLHT|nr:hypothetical protein L228DRAFT_249663 [Xylona heveae TC161]KZF20845.1 hypothetical protein L228DRAFT_249663 [Xylona heveae TC161]
MDMSSHSSSSSGMSGMSHMQMTFFSDETTPLYSTGWTPSGTGSYAGTCIFLILLAVIFRALFAFKHVLEKRWLDQALNRRYIVVAGEVPEAERSLNDPDAKTGTLVSSKGLEERVRVVRRHARGISPWRLSVDVPRAGIATVIAGVGYLLMLAVMTMNVGYFLSVLGGTFLGELAFGRYAQLEEH